MKPIVLLTALLLALAGHLSFAKAGPKPDEVKKLAQELAKAVVKQDYAGVIDLTHPAIVKEMGSRMKAIELIELMMKGAGFSYKEMKVGDPGEFHSQGANTFVVIPIKLEVNSPRGLLRGDSYLLGISPDDGKTWTFVEGYSMEKAEKLLPKLPEKLKLPDLKKPDRPKPENK
jgi:hypothetical protein